MEEGKRGQGKKEKCAGIVRKLPYFTRISLNWRNVLSFIKNCSLNDTGGRLLAFNRFTALSCVIIIKVGCVSIFSSEGADCRLSRSLYLFLGY